MQRELIFLKAHFLANSFHIQGGNWPIIIQTMAARMFKWLGGSFLISIMLLVGMVPAGYFIYRDGAEMVGEVQNQARSRASQLTVALGAQASEATSPEALVGLCETMKQLVQDSQEAARAFVVEETFFIDLEGRVLAHNDIARVAKDSGITYTEEKYKEVLLNARRYPLDLEVIGRTTYRPDAPLAWMIPMLEKYIPDLRANRFHVAYAVYLPDADVPSGSLHVYLRNDGIDKILNLYWQNVLRTITYSLIAYGALTFILSILLALTIFGGKKARKSAPAAAASASGFSEWSDENADRSMDLEEAGFSNQPFESEATSMPVPGWESGGQPGSHSTGETSEWPAFPGAAHVSAPANSEGSQRSHTMEDTNYEAPRVIDRDILDAIPLKNGDQG
tara:strand:+ start:16038 stop:17213 length:1176 start_codon:yes stop_codon:yes gene_type:complete